MSPFRMEIFNEAYQIVIAKRGVENFCVEDKTLLTKREKQKKREKSVDF